MAETWSIASQSEPSSPIPLHIQRHHPQEPPSRSSFLDRISPSLRNRRLQKRCARHNRRSVSSGQSTQSENPPGLARSPPKEAHSTVASQAKRLLEIAARPARPFASGRRSSDPGSLSRSGSWDANEVDEQEATVEEEQFFSLQTPPSTPAPPDSPQQKLCMLTERGDWEGAAAMISSMRSRKRRDDTVGYRQARAQLALLNQTEAGLQQRLAQVQAKKKKQQKLVMQLDHGKGEDTPPGPPWPSPLSPARASALGDRAPRCSAQISLGGGGDSKSSSGGSSAS